MNLQTRLDSLRLATRLGWAPRLPKSASEKQRQEYEDLVERARTSPGDASLPGILQRAAEQSDWPERGVHEILERSATTPSSAVCELLTSTVQAGIVSTFLGQPDPTAGLCAETDLVNFHPAKRAILIGERLTAVSRGGEFKEVAFPGTLEETRLFRFGGQFFLNEEEFLGDRTGFLSAAVESISRSCAFVRGDLVASVLLANAVLATDGLPLFDSGHGNVGTATLDKTSLSAALSAMQLQTGPDGSPLNIRGKTLLVCPELEGAARVAIRDLEIVGSPEVAINLLVDARLSLGVTDPRDSTALTGSAAGWYLFASPTEAPVLEMAFLAGSNRMPQVRSWVPDRSQWGWGCSIAFDIGATALDFRGVYKSTGAGA